MESVGGVEAVDVEVVHEDGLLGRSGGNHSSVRQNLGLQSGALGLVEGSAHDGLAQGAERGSLNKNTVRETSVISSTLATFSAMCLLQSVVTGL